jgi:type VI protein secretion system component VasF
MSPIQREVFDQGRRDLDRLMEQGRQELREANANRYLTGHHQPTIAEQVTRYVLKLPVWAVATVAFLLGADTAYAPEIQEE